MALTLSGSPTVNASIVDGVMAFAAPSGTFTGVSVRTAIREALAFGIKNNITKTNGFFNDVGEVFVNAVANFSKRTSYPSIDILWLRERYTNNIRGGNSLGGYNKIANILLDCYLFEDNCKDSPEKVVLKRENIVADIEKHFGVDFSIPNSAGVTTAFNSILVNNIVHGIQATEPYGSVEIELEVYYRIELADPTQQF